MVRLRFKKEEESRGTGDRRRGNIQAVLDLPLKSAFLLISFSPALLLYSPSANRGDWIRTSDLLVPKTSILTWFDRVKPLENKGILHLSARFAIRFNRLQETLKNKGKTT